jgi:RNA polymerase sporulation-specific sigma factor
LQQDIIQKAKNGDSLAVEEIVAQYKGLVRSLANRFYLVGGDKDDLLQEGMLGLFYAISNYDQTKGSFPAFAELCIKRQIVDAVKRDSAIKNKPLANYVDLNSALDVEDDCNPLESLLHKEHALKIAMVIANVLTPFERTVITLFAQGYSYEDIAEKTNKSYKSVDGALQRARKKLLEIKE